MKKFIVMILCVSTFFIGLGGLIETVGARFKSDERALEIMRLARQAIGGEQNIRAVQALTIKGSATKTFEFDNTSRTERGDWELNLELPNKISKMMKIEKENGTGNTDSQTFEKRVDVVVVRKGDGTETETVRGDLPQKVVVVTKDDKGNVLTEEVRNPNDEGQRFTFTGRANADNHHQNELFRTMIALLLTTPQDTDAEYKFVGEQSVDGANCEIVQISSGNSSIKLFINKSSHLPVMMSFTDAKPFIFRLNPTEANSNNGTRTATVTMNRVEPQMGEYQVKFSDYRSVGGVQFPYKWTQMIDGKADETIEVSAYEINPANIADKFKQQPQKIEIRTEKQ